MKKILSFCFSFLFLFSFFSISFASAANLSGFIPGQIWYSSDNLTEGEIVDIHTAVWNNEKVQLLVKVEFYDKNVILGSRELTILPLELKDVSISWKVTSGDHLISAKIISSSSNASGKKQEINLSRNSTSNDKRFVPVKSKDDSDSISETDKIKDQIKNTSDEISEIIPDEVKDSFSQGLDYVDDFRLEYYDKISEIKSNTKDDFEKIKNTEPSPDSNGKKSIEDATEKPITYIKLLLFTALAFIFGNKIIFYGIIILIIFYIIRSIYKKLRYR